MHIEALNGYKGALSKKYAKKDHLADAIQPVSYSASPGVQQPAP